MRINKHDTQGTKPLLGKGELGYDDYTAGGDTGRVYVGTGIENIALAERLESNMMTKAQFNALAEERKANRAGSGFDEWGKHYSSASETPINNGLITTSTSANGFTIGRRLSDGLGISKTKDPYFCIGGVISRLVGTNITDTTIRSAEILLPTAPNIYPHDTVLTAEQINSGVIKHADASNSGLIVNGKFDTDTSGWTGLSSSLIIETGKLKITNTSATNGAARQTFSSIVGKEYIVEFEVTSGSHNLGMQIKGDSSGITGWSVAGATTGRYTFKYTATTTTTYLLFGVYNNSLGAYAYVDNVAVYPADAISRSDLVLLESWHEDISEKNFVYPLGNVQYLGANTDGLTGIANGAFTGFETYSLFGNWQTPSALIGKGYVWSSLTEAQRKAFIANPDNNCYLDGVKVIQVRYRVRVVQGWGDDWGFGIDVTRNYSAPDYGRMCFKDTGNSVKIKGKLTNVLDISTRAGNEYISVPQSGYAPIGQFTNFVVGEVVPDTGSSVAYEGKCFALPIALVSRRNQGMYHPVYNANGTKKASDDKFWYDTAVSFTSISDCFDPAKLLTASGYIGTVSGRPDGVFYDQVHESDILDLRNSSKKVEDYNRLIGREFNKLVAGTTRGKEGEWEFFTENNITLTYANYFSSIDTNNYILTPQKLFTSLPLNTSIKGKFIMVIRSGAYIGKIITSESIFIDTNYFQIQGYPFLVRFTDGTIVPVLTGVNVDIIFARPITRTKSNTLLHCDIVGNPSNYPTTWKQNGVFGTALIVAEDGTSLLPDGARDTFKLSRKANATPLLCLRSTDSGATWTSFTPTFSTTTNAITLIDEPAANLVMVYYQTHTSMAIPVANSEVSEYGKAIGTNGLANAYLVSTLIGKVSTANTAPYLQMGYDINAYRIDTSTIKWSTTATEIPVHSALSLGGGASGVATVKVLPYLTRLNGKAYLNLVFKEMKYGSYATPTVVTSASATYTINMTYKINIAGCALDNKVIQWIGTTTTSAIDWSLYDVSPTGVIYLLSTGVVYANARLYDGDSWGDDNKFNIVNNVSATTDTNGATILIGQKTVELNYFIAGDE